MENNGDPLRDLIEKYLRSPMNQLTGVALVAVKPGEVILEVNPKEMFYNSLNVLHGGYAATLLDTACGMASTSVLDNDHVCMTAELKVAYLRKITVGTGTLTITGRVQKPGRQIIFAQAAICDAGGRELAAGTSTMIVLPKGTNS